MKNLFKTLILIAGICSATLASAATELSVGGIMYTDVWKISQVRFYTDADNNIAGFSVTFPTKDRTSDIFSGVITYAGKNIGKNDVTCKVDAIGSPFGAPESYYFYVDAYDNNYDTLKDMALLAIQDRPWFRFKVMQTYSWNATLNKDAYGCKILSMTSQTP